MVQDGMGHKLGGHIWFRDINGPGHIWAKYRMMIWDINGWDIFGMGHKWVGHIWHGTYLGHMGHK